VHFCVTKPSKAFQPMVKYCGPVGLPNTAFRSKMAVSTIPAVYNPAVPALLSKSRDSRQIYGSSRSMLSSPGMTFTTGPFQKTGVGPSLHFDRGAYRIASSSDSLCSRSSPVPSETSPWRSYLFPARRRAWDPKIAARADRKSARAYSRWASASPWPGSAPTRPARGVFGADIVRSVVRLRRPPADRSVKWEKAAAPREEHWYRLRKHFQFR
jgi:hypothetical protein